MIKCFDNKEYCYYALKIEKIHKNDLLIKFREIEMLIDLNEKYPEKVCTLRAVEIDKYSSGYDDRYLTYKLLIELG